MDGLKKQIVDLQNNIESLKQSHSEELKTVNEQMKSSGNEFEKEKTR